jgi:N-dimethylarginine dimethylaminohydrolase
MVSAYEDAGVTVHRLEPDPALAYQVFSRDSSIWASDGPIVTQLNQWWRRGEYAPVLRFYEQAGIPIAHMVTAASFEGGDLVLPRERCALIGHCEERTQRPAALQVARWLEQLGWEVRLQPFDPHFVHIDVIVCMAAPGLAVICEEAAPPGLADWLTAMDIELVAVSYADVMRLGANVMALGGDRVLSAAGAGELNERLRALGLTVYDPDLWPFTMGGGGPHCLAQPLRRGP